MPADSYREGREIEVELLSPPPFFPNHDTDAGDISDPVQSQAPEVNLILYLTTALRLFILLKASIFVQ